MCLTDHMCLTDKANVPATVEVTRPVARQRDFYAESTTPPNESSTTAAAAAADMRRRGFLYTHPQAEAGDLNACFQNVPFEFGEGGGGPSTSSDVFEHVKLLCVTIARSCTAYHHHHASEPKRMAASSRGLAQSSIVGSILHCWQHPPWYAASSIVGSILHGWQHPPTWPVLACLRCPIRTSTAGAQRGRRQPMRRNSSRTRPRTRRRGRVCCRACWHRTR